MKEITKYFLDQDILFKEFTEVFPKELGSKKSIKIFCATASNRDYYAIFVVESKSRFIRKNANDLIELFGKLIDFKGHNFKKKVLLISSPLCSKAKKFLEDEKWSVKIDFM